MLHTIQHTLYPWLPIGAVILGGVGFRLGQLYPEWHWDAPEQHEPASGHYVRILTSEPTSEPVLLDWQDDPTFASKL
jgi:hypothetical protein